MALIQKIPLNADTADQTVSIELGGNPYILRVMWNERFGYFSLSVNTIDNLPILTNIKMVKNYPLTAKFKNTLLPFGSFYFIEDRGFKPRALYEDLAVNYNLYYYEPDIEPTAEIVRDTVAEVVIGTTWDSGFSTWDSGDTTWDM